MDISNIDRNNKSSYVKGGRKMGVYNGDIESGCYIDVHGHFISREGVAIDEEGYILHDECGRVIEGDTPSYIPIEEYRDEDEKKFLSEYEKRKRVKKSNHIDSGILIVDYYSIFNIDIDLPDEYLISKNVVHHCIKRYKANCMTVMVNRSNVFRNTEIGV